MEGSRRQVQALSLALIMLLSVVGGSLAFAGSAAGTVQDFDGISTSDVEAGEDSTIEQEITLENVENDGNTDTIEISNDASGLDDTVIAAAGTSDGDTRVTTDNSHDASVSEVQSDGTIVVDLAAENADTSNIVVTAELDLSSYQDKTIQYKAESQANSVSQSTTFDISVARPDYDSAVIPETNPDTLEVTFDEDVQADGTDAQVRDAFSISGATPSVNGFSEIKNGDTVVLDLDGNVSSDTSGITVDYDGNSNSNPLSNNADASVDAQDFSGESVTSDADPVITSAVVQDGPTDQIVITTSENVDANGLGTGAFSLGDSRAAVDAVDTASDGSSTIKLGLDSSITPGADLTGLSYDRAAGDVVASADTDDELYAQDVTVSNNVVPSISSAEVTSANPDEILVTYDGPIERPGSANSGDFTITGRTVTGLDFTAGTSTQMAVELSSAVQASGGSPLNTLNYDEDTAGSAGTESVQSVAGVAANSPDSANPTNNVAPTVTDATVQDGSPGEVQLTFSEPVSAASGVNNIDSAVTDAFEFDNNAGADLRIKNVEGGSISSTTTVTLNFGLEDGTTQEVTAGDDLSGTLSYDPTASDVNNPIVAASGTQAAVDSFSNRDVTNNVDVDVESASVNYDESELRVTFTEGISQAGTDSEVVNEFDTSSVNQITLNEETSFDGIENGDTVVFTNFADSGLNSGTTLATFDYTGSGALIETESGEDLNDFDSTQSINNNIQPLITGASVSNGNPGEIDVTYTEDITGSDDPGAANAFSLSGPDAPSITEESATGSTLTLTLGENVEAGDDLGTLTYNGGTDTQEVLGVGGDSAPGRDGDSADVTNGVGNNPTLQNVTIDDVSRNNNYDNDGEMLLAFDQDVTVTDDGTATGLTFTSNNPGVSVSIVDGTITSPGSSDDNVVSVDYTSDSGSADTNIQQGDSLDDATLTVDGTVDIEGQDTSNSIAENTVSDVRNEIAGELATVQSTEIDTELIGTEVDAAGGDFTVTVTGLRDANGNRVIDDTVEVDIGGAAPDDLEVTPNRFSDSATASETPEEISKGDVDIGSEATVDVKGADVADAATVTYVHEAFTASEGYQLTSQPMPGEFVTGDGITDVSYYDADGSTFASYGSEGEVQDVHNALFVHAETAGAEYGFAYDEDRSGQQTNVGDVPMSEGWHIVGSNYDINNGGNDLDLSVDLGTENPPSSAAVQVQLESLPGSTLADDTAVGSHGVYYVYLHQEDNRPIVLPAYSGTNTDSEDTSG